jgi:hypothetical protein
MGAADMLVIHLGVKHVDIFLTGVMVHTAVLRRCRARNAASRIGSSNTSSDLRHYSERTDLQHNGADNQSAHDR